MKVLAAQVREFKQAAGQYMADRPSLPPDDVVDLCLKLIDEEQEELNDAFATSVPGGMVTEVADAICDLLYVVTGLGLAMGLPLAELMDEVHRTNMAKFGPGSHRDPVTGKQLKPPGWTPPAIAGILTAQLLGGEYRGEVPAGAGYFGARQAAVARAAFVRDTAVPVQVAEPTLAKQLTVGTVAADDIYEELCCADVNGELTFYVDRILRSGAEGRVRVVRDDG